MKARASVLVLALLAAGCDRAGEEPAPASAPAAASTPPGAGPPPSTVPSTTPEERRAALRLGEAIPEAVTALPLPVADGQPIALGQARRDKGLLVVFTSNACPYAKAWEKRLVALGNQHSDLGLGVVFINSNDPKQNPLESIESMTRRVEEAGHRFAYASDASGTVARAFGAARTPEAFLFDAQGRLAYHGTVDDNAQDETQVTAYWLKDALAAVAGGQPIPVAETKALGCAIKLAPLPV
jgi:peroxiredoxin